MANLVYQNMEIVGPPKYSEEALKVLREIQKNVGTEQLDNPLAESCKILISPQKADENYESYLPAWQNNFSSDDYVDYTWHAPSARYFVAKATPVTPDAEAGFLPSGKVQEKSQDQSSNPKKIDYSFSSWVWNALSGIRCTIDPCTNTAAKIMGMSIIDLLTKPDTVKEAQDEFKRRTGGGVRGSQWVAPLLPKDFPPPIDLKWPEYVTTERGYEWCIPTPIKK
jgi:aminobenzoyl-glutamate utilization protein B